MEPGTAFLWTSFWFGIGAIILTILELFSSRRSYGFFSATFSIISVCVLGGTLLLLLLYFVTSNLGIEYVHSYTKVDHPLEYKISGVWAGQKGSLLLWTFFIGLAIGFEEVLARRKMRTGKGDGARVRKSPLKSPQWAIIRLVSLVLFLVFIAILISVDTFAPTRPEALEQRPDGFGLSNVLLTPLMVLHPPIEFAAYAFTVIPLAAGFTFLITGDREWHNFSMRWGRLAWLLMTITLGLGGLWAYIILGWAGYWAWDPVETANLLPWLALTGLVHAQIYSKNKKAFKYLAPVFAILSFVLTLLATFVTRSGLWVSVHDFADIDAGSVTERLKPILTTSPTGRFIMTMIVVTLIVGGALAIWRYIKSHARRSRSELIFPVAYIGLLSFLSLWAILFIDNFVLTGVDLALIIGLGNGLAGIVILLLGLIGIPIIWMFLSTESLATERWTIRKIVDQKNLMSVTLVLILLGTLVTLYLLIAGVEGIRPEDYESNAPYIVAPLMSVLVGCLVWKDIGRKATLYLIVGTTLSIVALWVLDRLNIQDFTIGALFTITLAMAIIALVASFQGIQTMARSRRVKNKYLKTAGLLLLVSSILGITQWGSAPSDMNLGLGIVGFSLSVITFLGAVMVLNGRSFKVGVVGAVCGILSFGFYLGSILGIVSLLLIIGARSGFVTRSSNRKRLPVSILPKLKASSSHLIHLGVVMVILGYIFSQGLISWIPAQPEEAKALLLRKGESADFGGYSFVLKSSNGERLEDDPAIDIIEVTIEIRSNDAVVGNARLSMVLDRLKGYYNPEVFIHSTAINDLYFIPLGFWSDDAGDFIRIQDEPGLVFLDDEIDSVVIRINVIPGVSMVWGGYWVMVVGISIRLVVDYLPLRPKRRPGTGGGTMVEESISPKVSRDGMVECPECKVRLKERNLTRHLRKVHGRR